MTTTAPVRIVARRAEIGSDTFRATAIGGALNHLPEGERTEYVSAAHAPGYTGDGRPDAATLAAINLADRLGLAFAGDWAGHWVGWGRNQKRAWTIDAVPATS